MTMCTDRYAEYMHEYLDGDISREHEHELKKHLQECHKCKEHMHELNDTVAFIKSAAHVTAPIGLEQKIMNRLPKRKSMAGIQKWFRRHPFIVAAAVFMLFMSAGVFGTMPHEDQFSVTKQPNLIVDGQTVIVPKGEVVEGDIVVRNGDIVIEGQVEGNVTVINGKYMASTLVVTGQIEEIDQTFELIWYEIKSYGKWLLSLF